MKVLQVIPSMSAVHGGPSYAVRLIEQALVAEGIVVEIATTDDDGQGRRISVSSSERTWRGGRENLAAFDSLVAPPVRHYFPKRLDFYKVSPGFARWIFWHARDYDLVHIHALFSFTSVVAAWAARRAGVPYIVRPLGALNSFGVTQRRPWLKWLSLKLIEGPILRNADSVHFTSAAERHDAESLGVRLRSTVVPLAVTAMPAVDVSVFYAVFPQLCGMRCVLTVSRLNKVKNLEGLLRAFARVVENRQDVRLVIAGDGEVAYLAELKRLADELGLSERVAWTGFIEGELKASAFAAAQVFALPSFSENFGIAAAEALMAGLPCVLGEGVALAKEVAQAGAGVVTSPDPQSIAWALNELLSNDALLTEMGERARLLAAERFSLRKMGASLHGLYDSILSRSSRVHVE